MNRLSVCVLLAGAMIPTGASAATLDDEYFQRMVRDYQKYHHDGQIVYCKKEKPIGSSVPAVQCITEAALRARVENARRSRNAVTPYTG